MAERWRPYGGLVYFHLLLDALARAGHLEAAAPEPLSADPASPRTFPAQSVSGRPAAPARLDAGGIA